MGEGWWVVAGAGWSLRRDLGEEGEFSFGEDVVQVYVGSTGGEGGDGWAEEVIPVEVCWMLKGDVHDGCKEGL